jgi:hypothetical protein
LKEILILNNFKSGNTVYDNFEAVEKSTCFTLHLSKTKLMISPYTWCVNLIRYTEKFLYIGNFGIIISVWLKNSYRYTNICFNTGIFGISVYQTFLEHKQYINIKLQTVATLALPKLQGKWRILVTVNFCQLLLQKYLYLNFNVIKNLEIWQWVKIIND